MVQLEDSSTRLVCSPAAQMTNAQKTYKTLAIVLLFPTNVNKLSGHVYNIM